MLFKTFGDPSYPTVLLLHGAGLSWWSYRAAAALLEDRYHVSLALIDGYGEAADQPFVSIQASATALTEHIRTAYGGHVFALGGLSLGAQIAVETLARTADIADFAVLESALVCPLPGAKTLFAPMARMSFGLLHHRGFAQLQAKSTRLPDSLFEEYFRDSLRLSRETLANTLVSNGTYALPPALASTHAKTLVIAGEKEPAMMRRSARMLHVAIPNSELAIYPRMKHGELSLAYPQTYVTKLKSFFDGETLPPT